MAVKSSRSKTKLVAKKGSKGGRSAKPRLIAKASEDEEVFRPPRIPKFLVKEDKKKKKDFIEEDFDDEPIYTDDYDNTIYSMEY